MRFAILLSACLPVCLSGCSSLVRLCGKDLGTLKTRDDVRQMFGEPFETSHLGNKDVIEDHITHSKLSRSITRMGGGYDCSLFFTTFGLSELIEFPRESYRAIRKSIDGQNLRFQYDPQGKLARIELDGEPYGAR